MAIILLQQVGSQVVVVKYGTIQMVYWYRYIKTDSKKSWYTALPALVLTIRSLVDLQRFNIPIRSPFKRGDIRRP